METTTSTAITNMHTLRVFVAVFNVVVKD